jgi:hypothetical protein
MIEFSLALERGSTRVFLDRVIGVLYSAGRLGGTGLLRLGGA